MLQEGSLEIKFQVCSPAYRFYFTPECQECNTDSDIRVEQVAFGEHDDTRARLQHNRSRKRKRANQPTSPVPGDLPTCSRRTPTRQPNSIRQQLGGQVQQLLCDSKRTESRNIWTQGSKTPTGRLYTNSAQKHSYCSGHRCPRADVIRVSLTFSYPSLNLRVIACDK